MNEHEQKAQAAGLGMVEEALAKPSTTPPHIKIENPAKPWWSGDDRVEPYMPTIEEALNRHMDWPSDEFTDVYNRAYEAVHKALCSGNAERDALKAANERLKVLLLEGAEHLVGEDEYGNHLDHDSADWFGRALHAIDPFYGLDATKSYGADLAQARAALEADHG